jgi:uncharacterized protein YeaO (DUF488 family)
MKDRPDVTVARVYDDAGGDAVRVLVDRLWPRGIAKNELRMDEWAKEVAPSTELRRWYGHDPARFHEFARRYRAELHDCPAADGVARLATTARGPGVVLLTATRDVDRSAARVLRDVLIASG